MVVTELLGESHEIAGVRARVAQLLKRWAEGQRLPPVLIDGETGTGKGLLARALHRNSPRRAGAFVDVNCAAIPETLLEAEMFGFERGAFSDARQAKPGLFETANGGTIFLDEIGLLPGMLQGKLLKVIEEHSVRRLGSTRSQAVDVWVISASNEDLTAAMRQHRFREDLYHRLAVLTLRMPPLRERGEDILLLAEHFLARACGDYNLPPKALGEDARAALTHYSWPGNVRELANVMERAALLTDSSVVTADMLTLPPPRPDTSPPSPDRALKAELGEVERQRLLEVLELSNWNLSRAAARLGIPRNTLRYRIQKHELTLGAPGWPAPPRSASSGVAAPAPSSGRENVQWEPRRLALLRAVIAPPPGTELALLGSRAIELLAEKVEAFEGRVEETSPSGLVAVFGMEPSEDAASRAAHAALAVARAGHADSSRWTVRLAVHVGQFLVAHGSHGPEIAPDAKRETWPMLDALVARAEPGWIVASDSMAPFLARRFELSALDAPGAAGAAVRVLGREHPGVGTAPRRGAFIGRRHDLELLESYLAAALRGWGNAVGIAGEVGIGKSRLVAEFRQRLVGEPVRYCEGACLSYGTAIPYLPVLDLVRQYCGIGETDSAETIRDKVEQSLAGVGMDTGAAPYLLHLLGIHQGTGTLAALTAEAIKLRTLETLRQMLFLKAGRQRPIVYVVEDLHWIDRASEELFASLVENLPGTPILFLTTYRPGYRPPWLDRSYATQMALLPLSSEDSLAVARSLLKPGVADGIVQAILDKAEGNPFFLEELCRAVGEHGNLQTTLAVPDTIQEVLLARIERLPDEPKRVLQSAAVLGREFPARLLQAIWSGSGSLDAHLGLLTGLEFLYQRTGGEETVHMFKHALTQEVAYASLPPSRRQALHAAAGRALETVFANRLEEAYDRLAYHYARTEEALKAIEYLSRFAEKSARSYAHEEAVQAWKEALRHVERLPADVRDRRHLELVLRLPYSLLPLGRIEEIHAVLLQERDRLERLNDSALASHYYFLLGRAYIFCGGHDLAAENARRAIAEAERCGDEATSGKAYSVLTLAAGLSGQASRGIEDGLRAAALLGKTKEQSWLCYAYWALGLCYAQTGAFAEALAAEGRALAIAQAIGDGQEAYAVWVLGAVHAAMGEWEQGITECQHAVEKTRDPLNRAIATGHLGFAYLEKGDAQRAVLTLEQSIPFLHQFKFRAFEGWFTAFLAEAHRLEARLDTAEALAGDALRIATEASFGVAVGWAELALGRIARARGDLAQAGARLKEALGSFSSVGSRYECARTHVDLASIGWERGDPEAARRHLDEAHGLFSALGIPRYRERVEQLAAAWGILLGDRGPT